MHWLDGGRQNRISLRDSAIRNTQEEKCLEATKKLSLMYLLAK
jgi:hypothetical protein